MVIHWQRELTGISCSKLQTKTSATLSHAPYHAHFTMGFRFGVSSSWQSHSSLIQQGRP